MDATPSFDGLKFLFFYQSDAMVQILRDTYKNGMYLDATYRCERA